MAANDLPRVAQLFSGRARIQTQMSESPKPLSYRAIFFFQES